MAKQIWIEYKIEWMNEWKTENVMPVMWQPSYDSNIQKLFFLFYFFNFLNFFLFCKNAVS